ncbi:hypothetical protein [Patulibacter defluvii]|uniref:hypothetical protein n=1 Tax=Patulibacter defluvii TaxID=3095358 RepID=UPI002A74CF17|nr:hypothetical protein [Patulibacter sp. DM4]
MPRRSLLRAALLAALATLAALPAAASAADGTYSVFACKGPSGAPVGFSGWTPAASQQAQYADGCSGGGPLSLSLNAGAGGGQVAKWTFDAPAGTRVAGLNLLRTTQGLAGTANTNVSYVVNAVGVAPDNNTKELESCEKKNDKCQTELAAPVSKPGLDASSIVVQLSCAMGVLDSCPTAAPTVVSVGQAVVTLRDTSAPRVSGTKVVDDGDKSGTLRVRFDASDQGGGLYRAATRVDGKVVATQGLGDGNCADADPANGDAYEFAAAQPCPAGVSGRESSINYKSLSAGPHTVQIEVEDAAGNSTAVYATQFPKANADGGGTAVDPQRLIHGRIRAWFPTGPKGRQHLKSRTFAYGVRPLIRGYVVDRKGKGIVGARVDVYHVTRNGKRTLVKTGLKTRRKGLLTYIVSKRLDTRRIELTYRALRPGPITGKVSLSVRVTKDGKTFVLPENRKGGKKKSARK